MTDLAERAKAVKLDVSEKNYTFSNQLHGVVEEVYNDGVKILIDSGNGYVLKTRHNYAVSKDDVVELTFGGDLNKSAQVTSMKVTSKREPKKIKITPGYEPPEYSFKVRVRCQLDSWGDELLLHLSDGTKLSLDTQEGRYANSYYPLKFDVVEVIYNGKDMSLIHIRPLDRLIEFTSVDALMKEEPTTEPVTEPSTSRPETEPTTEEEEEEETIVETTQKIKETEVEEEPTTEEETTTEEIVEQEAETKGQE